MEFITVRDLRTRPSQVWDKLRQRRDLILTSSGRPIAVLSHIEEGDVEETLAALRRARAQAALSRLRADAATQGLDRLSPEEIEAEIAAARTLRTESARRKSAQ
jgi:antitoxin (DNA-binding transcriptional repressor) of toxin-antitoxin stability system